MTLSSTALLKHQGDITLKDVVTEPQEILALFASKKQQDKGKLEQIFLRMVTLKYYRGFLPYATFGTWKKTALAENRISKISILCTQ